METIHPLVSDARSTPSSARLKQGMSLNFSERKLLLICADLMLLIGAFFTSLMLRSEFLLTVYTLWEVGLWLLILIVLWGVIATTMQIYTLAVAAQLKHSVGRAGLASLLTSVVYLAVPYITPDLPNSRRDMLVFPLLCVAVVMAWRAIYALFLVQSGMHHRALLIGSGPSMEHLTRLIGEHSAGRFSGMLFGYQFLGLVPDGEEQPGDGGSIPQLGNIHDLGMLIQRYRPHELVLSDEIVGALMHFEQSRERPRRRRYDMLWTELFDTILESCELGISITTAGTVYESVTGRVPVQQLGSSLDMAMPLNQSATYRLYLMLRRALDIGASLLGCVVLALAVPLVWLANRLSSPGPLFYAQERVGEGGRTFRVLKFRSMVVNAERFGAVWASENDPRITPVGQLLRKTRVDELPQFWNILRGDMSLIGPRPERPEFVNQLARDIPFYRACHAIKPGLTGWAQVCYRYGASMEDSLIKLQYDLYYVKHVSLLMDLRIVLLTIPVVLGFKGR
jgi:exopolysaccharide biosynthesis polyprenyl glycosylphosphotransferase